MWLYVYLTGVVATIALFIFVVIKEERKLTVNDIGMSLVFGFIGSWIGVLVIGSIFVFGTYGNHVVYRKKEKQ